MSSSVANIRIEPVDVYWKQYEQEQFDFTDATAAGLGGKYVKLYLPTGAEYYAWFDENNTDVDPSGGGTAIEVDYAASATASAIASAFQAAVDAVSGFTATVSGAVVTVTRDAFGDCADSTLGNVTAGVALTKTQNGKDVYLGLLQGDVSVSFEETSLQLTAHQTGTSVRADLRQGNNATISLVLQESDNALRKSMFSNTAGGAYTPMGGTELFGWGDNKQGLSTIVDAGRLILHPVALDSSDYSRDLCFWYAYPKLNSITFSGENPEVMEVEFTCYIDESKDSAISLFAFGDHTQI